MNAVNSVHLFILVWTFTAVSRADDDVCSVSCEDVTGTVGKEVTLTCSVSQKCSECCITLYKFPYPEKYKDSTICRQDLHDSCEQRNSFTCRYTPTTAMTEKFRFFLQTIKCGPKNTEFTVNITEPSKPAIITEAPGRKEPRKPEAEDHDKKEEPSNSDNFGKYEHERAEGRGFKVAVIAAVVSSFIIIIVPVIYKMEQHYKQKRFMNRCPETVI